MSFRSWLFAIVVAGVAQATSPESGVVRSSGQPIPGATVTATQGAQKFSTVTDESGRYQLDPLPAGNWKLEISMFGFTSATREVPAGSGAASFDFDLNLKPRATVSARPGRNAAPGFQNLTLNPSADIPLPDAAAAGAPPESSNANEAFLVSGSLSRGLESTQQQEDAFAQRRGDFGRGDPQFGQQFGQPPGQQFGGAQAPGFGGPGGGGRGGRGGGGVDRGGGRRGPGGPGRNANFGNRAGRNNRGAIRGSAFFILGNSAVDARPFSLTGQSVPKPSYASARFGTSLGGQLKIPKLINADRTFFFLNYSGTRSRAPYQGVATVPTELERSGDFSQSFTRFPVQIFDPLTRQPFAGNQIPLSRFDPAALGLLRLSFIPLPNQPGNVQNYDFQTSVPNNNENLNIRLNQTITKKDRLDVNLNLQNRSSNNAQLYGFRDELTGFGLSSTLGYTHTFGRQIINSIRWNFSRNRSYTLPFFAYGPNVAEQLKINGVSTDPINFGPPNVSFTNFGALNDGSPSLQRNQTSGVNDSVILVRGRHNLTFGGEYRRMQINTLTDSNGRGSFSFSGLETSAFDSQGQPIPNTGYDFADFLLGLPQSSSVRFGTSSNYFRGSAYSLFSQDDFRVLSNLSLNLGLRYEYFTPLREKYNHIANLDIAPGFTGVAVVTPGQIGPYTGKFGDGLINPDKNNFSPRLGLAWRPLKKNQLQVRAGYGILYNGSIYNQFPSRLASQPPFARTATLVTSVARPLTIENGFAAVPSESITNTYAIDRYYRIGYAQTWNFSIQEPLPHSFVIEAAYLGTKGTRLDIQTLPNRAAPGSPLTAEQRRRIGNAVGFTFDSSNGDSIYHAAQFRLVKRFSKGISANVLYVYSKSIDNASTIGGGASVVAQNDQDLRAERGLSSFDQRHVLTASYILTSPFGENGLIRSSGKSELLLKDWTLSGGATAASGLPFTARVLGNQADTAGTGAVGSGRANATGLPVDSGSGFFNPAAYAIPIAGTFGDAGRNTIPGPGRFSLNLSFGRSFRLNDDRRRVEFRVDSQNFTNHVSYGSLNTIVNASNYGLPLAALPMRTLTATVRLRF
ncbi:MAG: TonB-dependent receptor domain-containing protein [Bryobacteraceae bacterium]